MDAMAAAREKMAQFMREKNHQQSDGERQASEQRGWVPERQSEGTGQTFQGNGLILRVGDCELPPSHKTSEKCQKKKSDGHD